MAARKIIKKQSSKLDTYFQLVGRYSPIWIPCIIVLLFILLKVWPSAKELSKLKNDIDEKKAHITMVNREMVDFEKMKKELDAFRIRVQQFEQRLPQRIKTTLIIETLQEITKKSKLQFSSLEPAPVKRHVLKETNDVFVELPVEVKLKCGYYDLVDFLAKIENASQLMKISNIHVKNDPSRDWEHTVEFSISAFSRGENDG